MDEYLIATKKYTKICKARNNTKFWADNIIEASAGLKDPVAWQNFYAFLSDDTHVFAPWETSLGECIDGGLKHPAQPNDYKSTVVMNGNVHHIRLTPTQNICNPLVKDHGSTKSVDRLPKGVSQKAPTNES